MFSDEFLERHERFDVVYTELWIRTVGRWKKLSSAAHTRWDTRKYKPGGFFLDHGSEPSIITSIRDGVVRGVSMVNGKSVVSDIHACGPELTTEDEAWKLAESMRSG